MTPVEKKKYITGLIIAASIIAGVLVLDLVTKAVTDGIELVLIPNFLIFNSVYNYNAAFSSSFGMPPEVFRVVVTVLTFVAIAVILFLLIWLKKKHILFTVSMAMILSGAAGNLIDRLMLGYVRDFIQIKYFGLTIFGSTSFAIFNVADMALVCGVIVMLVWVIFFFMRSGSGNDKATPMDPALVAEGPAKMPEKKEFKPVNRPEPDKNKKKKPDDKPPKEPDGDDKKPEGENGGGEK